MRGAARMQAWLSNKREGDPAVQQAMEKLQAILGELAQWVRAVVVGSDDVRNEGVVK